MVYLSAKYQEISLGSLFHSLLDDIEHIEAESLANNSKRQWNPRISLRATFLL